MKNAKIASCILFTLILSMLFCAEVRAQDFQTPRERLAGFTDIVKSLAKSTAAYRFFTVPEQQDASITMDEGTVEIIREDTPGWMNLIMIAIGALLVYLAIAKKIEPLLLLPIGFGAILANIPLAGMTDTGGILKYIFDAGLATWILPLIIFLCIGAMLDLGPLIALPRAAFLGAVSQLGIFVAVLAALALARYAGVEFSLRESCAVGSAAAASGPLAILVAVKLAPEFSGAITIAAYACLALLPIMQPWLARLIATENELRVQMGLLRAVSRREKIAFAFAIFVVVTLILPTAVPLVGMIVLGNIMRESGVVERLVRTTQGELANIATLALGLGIAAKLTAREFLRVETIAIIAIAIAAVAISTSSGILLGRLMHKISKGRVNPIIGAAGFAAFPAYAKIVASEGQKQNPPTYLMMQALAVNAAGLISAVIAAGVLLAIFQ